MLGTGTTRPFSDSTGRSKPGNMSVQTMNPFQEQGGQTFVPAPIPPKNGMRRQSGLWGGGGGVGANRNYMGARNGAPDIDSRLQVSDYSSAILDQSQVPSPDPYRPSGGTLARYHSAPSSFLASLAADFHQDNNSLSSFFNDADLPPLNTDGDSLDTMDTEQTSTSLFDDKSLWDARKFERIGNSQLGTGGGGGGGGGGGSLMTQKPLQSVYKHSMEVLHENPLVVEEIASSSQVSSSQIAPSSQMQSSSGLIMASSMGLVQPLSGSQSGQPMNLGGLPGSTIQKQVNLGTHLPASNAQGAQQQMNLSTHTPGSKPQPGQQINMGTHLTGSINLSSGLSSNYGGGVPSAGTLGGLSSSGMPPTSLLRQSSSPAGLLAQLSIDVSPPLTKTEKSSLSSPLAQSPDDSLSGGTSEDTSGTHGMISGLDMGGWEDAASSYMKSWGNDTGFSARKRYRDNVDLGDIILPSDSPVRAPSSLEHGPAPGSLTRHMSLPTSKSKTGGVLPDDLLQSVPCRIRAKRGCATHPRSIAERVRRTRISERMRKLQELVPNMDKQQTNTADMLDEAVEYVKQLQRQVQELTEIQKKCNGSCHQELKNSVL